MPEHEPDTELDEPTRAEERREARAPHTADRAPTLDEERAAERHEPDPAVADHERAMGRIGAEVDGEGRID